MPVSSNEISQMLAAQQQQAIGMANASAAQMQGPFAALSHAQTGGTNLTGAATGVGPGALQAAHTAFTGIGMGAGLAAAFGFAPRFLDPFTTGAHVAKAGYASAGMAGAIGNAALVGGVALGIGSVVSSITDNVIKGSMQQSQMMGAIQQGYGGSGMNLGGMDTRMSSGMANVGMGIASGAVGTSMAGMVNPESMTNLISQGMSSGQFRGVDSVNGFAKRLKQYTGEAARMAEMLKVSIDEAAATMDSIGSGYGMSGRASTGMIAGMASQVGLTGMSIETQMGHAGSGAAAFQGLGLSRAAGASYGSSLGQSLGYGLNSGRLDKNVIGDLGGAQAVSERFTSGGIRGLAGAQGMRILGAAMSGDGTLDQGIASKIAGGMLSREEINKLYHQNVKGIGGQRDLADQRNDLMGQFMSDYGAQGVATGLNQMNSNKSGGDFLTRQAMGLGKAEMEQLSAVGSMGGSARMAMLQAARDGFKSAGMHLSIPEALSRGMEQALGPIRETFQKYGRSIQDAISATVEDIGRDISGQGPAMFGSSKGVDAAFTLATLGSSDQAGRMGLLNSGGARSTGSPGAQTMIGSAFNALTPSAVQHFQAGGNIDNMDSIPGYGLGGIAGVVGAGMAGTAALGMSGEALGTGLLGVSARIAAKLPAHTGIWSMGGRGLVGGTAGAGRAATWLGGHALGGAGSLARLAGGPLGLALGATVGAIPDMLAMGGSMGATSGMMGLEAENYKFLAEAGIVTPEYATINSGSSRFIEARGGQAVVGMQKGEASVGGVFRDFAESLTNPFRSGAGTRSGGHALFSMKGNNVQNAYMYPETTGNQLSDWMSQVSDTSDLERRTGLSHTGLTDLATSTMNRASSNVTLGRDESVEKFDFYKKLGAEAARASAGTELEGQNLSILDIQRLGKLAGTDPAWQKANAAMGNLGTRNMSKKKALDLFDKDHDSGYETFMAAGAARAARGDTNRGLPDMGEILLGIKYKPRVTEADKKREELNEKIGKSISASVKDYKLGADATVLNALGTGSEEAAELLRKHVMTGFEGEPVEKAIAQAMVNSSAFLDFGKGGGSGELAFNKVDSAYTAELNRRRDGAQAYNQYKDSLGGSGVEELFTNSGIRGGSELGAHIEKMIAAMGKNEYNRDTESANYDKIRKAVAGMDPDEAFEISQALSEMAKNSGNPEMERMAMTAGASAKFRSRGKEDLKHAGRSGSKIALASIAFGGTDKVKHALGLSGSKEHREYIKDYVKTTGDLPASAKQALHTARKYDMQQANISPTQAGPDMADVHRIFDKEGVSGEEDQVAMSRLTETSDLMAAARSKGSGKAGYDSSINDFTRKLGEATGAVQLFIKGMGRGGNNQSATPGPTNTQRGWGEWTD